MGTWLFAMLLVVCVSGTPNFHIGLRGPDLQRYFGDNVRESVPDYEIVDPHHLHGSRHRRSLFSPKEPLRYDVTAFGENFLLHLEHNDKLIAPGCLVHSLKANGTKSVRHCPINEQDCYYQGKSLAHNGSEVSVSTCNGLHGLIRLPDRDYDLWIQPVKSEHKLRAQRSVYVANPHIIYKRAVPNRMCATQDVVKLTGYESDNVRIRRAVDDKYIEMLIVADKTMHTEYGNKLQDYLLTVVNVASRILADPSLGTMVHLTVVKIQILEEDQVGLVIEEDTDVTLNSFCDWQEKQNPADDNNPLHYDGAALISRLDLVHAHVRDTTGYATVSGMCGTKTRCSYNQDTGLSVGITLAHETGHLLGMSHDGADNSCENNKYVMSNMGGGGSTAMSWSTCSRDALNNFLASEKSSCLNDVPQATLALPKDLPGVVFDGNDQCILYLGEGSTICEGTTLVQQYGGDECARLVCFDPGNAATCKGDSVPRMDGTMCGDRKYCMHGQCVDIGPDGPPPQDGGWSDWEPQWSPCSLSCGGGVRFRKRKCDNPKPRLGGRNCEGSEILAELCNMQECDTSQSDFKASQCAATNNIPLNGRTYSWVPVETGGTQQCELHCHVEGQRTVALRTLNNKNVYQDGTICTPESSSYGRCVAGTCVEFGCDGKSNSTFQYDLCGVCGGQSNTCQKMSGRYTEGQQNQYVTFVTMPVGATSVMIINTNKFTQMAIKIGNQRVFNDDGRNNEGAGTYYSNGMAIKYERTPDEKITIVGPLSVPVEGQVWRNYGDGYAGVSPEISYEYYVSDTVISDYQWHDRNGACSKSCGGGVFEKIITCTQLSTGAEVDDHFCDLRQKPNLNGAACNNQACPPSWHVGEYGSCSKTCGGGTQNRTIQCVQDRDGQEVVLDDRDCPVDRRPADTIACNVNVLCPAVWIPSEWSACSLTCGRGLQTRTVSCFTDSVSGQQVSDSECSPSEKPVTQQQCVQTVCLPDITGDACQDVRQDCINYGDTLCVDYADFAMKNCMKHCSFCSATPTTCEDKSPDCPGYGVSICTGDYADWSRENCAKMCGYCGGPQAVCEDKNADCPGYGMSICTGDYADWSKENCAKMCGYCPAGGDNAVVQATCEDKNTDCPAYGMTICTGDYADWSKDNCAKMCGHCSSSDITTTTSVATTTTTASQTESRMTCEDKNTDCPAYGMSICTGDYADWSKDNCAKMCGHCSSSDVTTTISAATTTTAASQTESTTCEDKNTDCPAYGISICTGMYADWAKDNCAKMCGHCGSGGNSGVSSTMTTTTQSTTSAITTPSTTASTMTPSTTTASTTTASTMTPSTTTASTTTASTTTASTTTASTTHIPTTTTPATTPLPTTTATKAMTTNSASSCFNIVNNCAAYGQDFCMQTEYAVWARQNCALYCGFCDGEEDLREDCKDILDNCQLYGTSICTNVDYKAWVAANCARFCNVCDSKETSPASTTTTPAATTTTTPAPTSSLAVNQNADCKDNLDNCALYGASVCTTPEYIPWAKDNCASFCNLCEGKTIMSTATTTSIQVNEECKDLLDCQLYGASVCANTDYTEWVKVNCPKFCQVCPTSVITTMAVTTTTTDNSCNDLTDTCPAYGVSVCAGEYRDWASANCKRFCGFCGNSGMGTDAIDGGNGVTVNENGSGTQTADVSCDDLSPDCAAYGQSICTGDYAAWATDNCAKFCGHCGVVHTASSRAMCHDAIDICASYGTSVCSEYADWAAANCQRFCNKCGTRRRRSVPPPPHLTHTECNKVLTALSGSVALIGHPISAKCTHIIAAPIGSRVRISFNAILVSCEKGDWLEVQEEGGKIKGGKTQRDLCKQKAPVQWTTTGHLVTVKLSVSSPGHGYNMTYTIELLPKLSDSGCGRLLTNPTGIVASPAFPKKYPNDQLCLNMIVAPPTYTVNIKFNIFELESNDCTKDSVTLYDQEEGTKDVFCGTLWDVAWQSKGNKVKVIFSSDHQKNATGFLASYKFLAPWC